MKVLHINTGQTGGASICAIRISNALKQQGVESKLLVQAGESHDDITVAERDRNFWYSNPVLGKIKHLLNRTGLIIDNDVMWAKKEEALKNVNGDVYVNIPFSDYTNIAHHPLVEWADIIHLHWVSCLVDYPTFFKNVKKPIVWTLHDQHPAIGLMHFQSQFSPLPKELEELDKQCIEIKKAALKQNQNIYPVAISEMMRDIISKSEILKEFPLTLIHNGVDTNVFYPYNKSLVRTKWNIPSDAKVYLFSSYDLWVARKGLVNVIEAIESVDIPNKLLLCVGGIGNRKMPRTSYPIICVGRLNSQDELAELYSVSDFYIQSSCHEAFSQTSLEAMACGTPVISTPCSGATDLIRDFNGVICDGFDSPSLIKGIKDSKKKYFHTNIIRDNIVSKYDYSIIVQRYINLYNKILNL